MLGYSSSCQPDQVSVLLPTAMAEPSSSTLDDLRGRLHKYDKLAVEEIDKGSYCDDKQLARYQKQVANLAAEIDRQASGEVQLNYEPCFAVS